MKVKVKIEITTTVRYSKIVKIEESDFNRIEIALDGNRESYKEASNELFDMIDTAYDLHDETLEDVENFFIFT